MSSGEQICRTHNLVVFAIQIDRQIFSQSCILWCSWPYCWTNHCKGPLSIWDLLLDTWWKASLQQLWHVNTSIFLAKLLCHQQRNSRDWVIVYLRSPFEQVALYFGMNGVRLDHCLSESSFLVRWQPFHVCVVTLHQPSRLTMMEATMAEQRIIIPSLAFLLAENWRRASEIWYTAEVSTFASSRVVICPRQPERLCFALTTSEVRASRVCSWHKQRHKFCFWCIICARPDRETLFGWIWAGYIWWRARVLHY